jgi:tRNA G46 methylase TrmB
LQQCETTIATEKEKEIDERLPLLPDGHIDMSKVFGAIQSTRPIDIELGSGFGDWIVRQALAFSDRNHFAVELRADRVYQIFTRGCLATSDGQGLDNLCTIGADSGAFLRNHIHKATVASVFVNHPEPPTQVLGQNQIDLEGIMAGTVAESPHMLTSTTLGYAARVLVKGGRLVVVTDNQNYGHLVCATLVRLLRQKQGLLRGLDEVKAKKMKLKPVQRFSNDITLYEGIPNLQLGHARDEMLVGQSYFDRLWKTGIGGKYAETTRRFIVAVYRV